MARYSRTQLQRRRHVRQKAARTAARSPIAQDHLQTLKKASFGTFKPTPTPKKRDKVLHMQRREEWFQMMREKRNAA